MDDEAGWRHLLFALTGLTFVVYLYIAFFYPGTLTYSPFTIQDDQRLFLAWMARIGDPSAMPGDLIADYWQSVSPLAYRALFEGMAALGVTPLVFARLLPLPLMALCAWMAWRIAMRLTGSPVAAFVMAAMTMGFLFHEDSVFSATPRAFSSPLFLVFLDALLRRRGLLMVVTLFLLSSMYPTTALVGFGMLGLSYVRLIPRPKIILTGRSIALMASAAAVVVLAAVPLKSNSDVWDPVVTLDEAMTMPIMSEPNGRTKIVDAEGNIGWVCSYRMGFLPEIVPCDEGIPAAGLADFLLLSPLLIFAAIAAFRGARGLQTGGNEIYLWALIAAIVGYTIALVFAFKLHHPSRYSQRVLGLMEFMAIGQMLGLWLQGALRSGSLGTGARRGAYALGTILFVSFLTPTPGLRQPEDQKAFDYIASLPKDTRIAGLSRELNSLSAVAGRPILATAEHAIPYHMGYYRPFEQRLKDTLEATSSPDAGMLTAFIRKYDVDVIMMERPFFKQNELPERYGDIVPEAFRKAEQELRTGPSALERLASRCMLYEGQTIYLISAECLTRTAVMPQPSIGP